MNWRKVELQDLSFLQKSAFLNDLNDNNLGAVNIVLYSLLLDFEICITDNFLFRRFFEEDYLCLFFPLKIENENTSSVQINNALHYLVEDSRKTGKKIKFVTLHKDQKEILGNIFPAMIFSEMRERSDYIYLSEKLSLLQGQKLGRKRNHIHQFERQYHNYHFVILTSENINDALTIENKWLKENESLKDEKTFLELCNEKKIITYALENFLYFEKHANMAGGILYVDNLAAAFCISSQLSENITDVHFEKCIEPFAKNGGYTVINQLFSKSVKTKYINREEDLGIESLRKAKLSYYPEIILEKWCGEII